MEVLKYCMAMAETCSDHTIKFRNKNTAVFTRFISAPQSELAVICSHTHTHTHTHTNTHDPSHKYHTHRRCLKTATPFSLHYTTQTAVWFTQFNDSSKPTASLQGMGKWRCSNPRNLDVHNHTLHTGMTHLMRQ